MASWNAQTLSEDEIEKDARMWALIWGAYGAYLLTIAGIVIVACGWLARAIFGG